MYGLVLDIEVTMAYVEAEEEVYEYDDPLEFEIEQLKDEAGSSIVLSWELSSILCSRVL